MNAAMLSFGDLATDGFLIVHLAPIGAEVEPAFIRVLGHDAAGGADEARLVLFVMARHRKLQHIDGVAFDDILEYRTIIDEARRQRFEVLHARVIALHDVDLAVVVERQPQRERDALDRGELAVEGAVALWIAGHVVEQQSRRSAAALFGDHMGERTHLDVPVGAGYALQFAEFVHLIDPAAQAMISSSHLTFCAAHSVLLEKSKPRRHGVPRRSFGTRLYTPRDAGLLPAGGCQAGTPRGAYAAKRRLEKRRRAAWSIPAYQRSTA